ncbi:MAG: Na(+)-translocating NADH-quinone reductase subunit A [Dysgonamonadaceae bacterium]|jgi:Na+-transporting NADH:ubiquinone oxidoreductase subunit A|nr:Na(+)-translocating NADH-quinone reductase subunit A [Dysgonamonadaceae bacterium]
MIKKIRIKRGLDIPLSGKAQSRVEQAITSLFYTIFPDDYPGFTPKIAVQAGDSVQAGTALLYDKNRPEVKIVSPVSGVVAAVNRGEKRKLLSVVVEDDGLKEFRNFKDFKDEAAAIKAALCEAGIFAYIRQRPYDIVANPADTPRDIFVTGFSSAPLAPDADFILQGEEADFQKGLDILAKLTEGKVYLGVKPRHCGEIRNDVNVVVVDGQHPAGNVGVQINHIKPVNKGETVWTADAMTVVYIGRLFNKGVADFSHLTAIAGSEVKPEYRAYYKTLPGVCLKEYLDKFTEHRNHQRYISGNVLTGTQITAEGSLHAFDNLITVIPEGDDTHELLGWIMPRFNQFSFNKSYPAAWLNRIFKKKYNFDARIKGGQRAMIMSNEFDKVFPMDILPEYLLRAIIAFDIEKMENLGIYEVAPEDFALCEFVDTSKMELQKIVREGLDRLCKEMN